jgi:hypothetical protein
MLVVKETAGRCYDMLVVKETAGRCHMPCCCMLQLTAVLDVLQERCLHVVQLLLLLRLYLLPGTIRVNCLQVRTVVTEHSSLGKPYFTGTHANPPICTLSISAHQCTTSWQQSQEHMRGSSSPHACLLCALTVQQ